MWLDCIRILGSDRSIVVISSHAQMRFKVSKSHNSEGYKDIHRPRSYVYVGCMMRIGGGGGLEGGERVEIVIASTSSSDVIVSLPKPSKESSP